MKCVNCSNDAAYTLADPGVSKLNYCALCLPPHLRERAALGQLPLIEVPSKDAMEEAIKRKEGTVKKTAAKAPATQAPVVTPEPVVEPKVEEPAVESTEEPEEEEE